MKDPIEREDAIKHFKAKADHYRKRLARIEAQGDAIGYDPTKQINGFKDEIAIYEDVVKKIKDIPSAEPKQGEWMCGMTKRQEADRWVIERVVLYCSECNGEAVKMTKFCPNCGCRMEGVNNEDDQSMDSRNGSGR